MSFSNYPNNCSRSKCNPKFGNPHQKEINRDFRHFLLWQAGYYDEPLPPTFMPENFTFPFEAPPYSEKLPSVSWINHSSYYIEAQGFHFLLDPIFSDRCSPVTFCGPKRRMEASPQLHEFKKIDFVIISHNHYDHLDRKSVLFIQDQFPDVVFVIPKGVKPWFRKNLKKLRDDQIIELDWWQSAMREGVKFTAVPAQHFSGRGIFDRNRSQWMGCVVDICQKKRFYFVGDTGYNSFDFKEIGKRFHSMDLSLIPIGAYLPRRFMRGVHVNPEEAVRIHKEVGSKFSIGGHWGTFRLAGEKMDQPPYDLYQALRKAEISPNHFCVLKPGQLINW